MNQYYAAGSVVSYNGNLYIAKYANPGYNPTISTYYWAPYTCSTSAPAPAPSPTPATGCVAPTVWVQGKYYPAGSVVSYQWNLYIAKYANPGYNPTISTYYWKHYSC
jgi:hypothetical protein